MTYEEQQIQNARDLLAESPEDPVLKEKLQLSEEILALRQKGDFYWDFDKPKSQRYHDEASRLSAKRKAL